ncbi:MAG: hypothetical protein ACI8W8_004585, partial [Rhodothermales bacterium]
SKHLRPGAFSPAYPRPVTPSSRPRNVTFKLPPPVQASKRKPLRRYRPALGPEKRLKSILRRQVAPPPGLALTVAIVLGLAGWLVNYLGLAMDEPRAPGLLEFLGIFIGGAMRIAAVWTFIQHYFLPGRRALPEGLAILEIFAAIYVLALVIPTALIPFATPAVLFALLMVSPLVHARLCRLAAIKNSEHALVKQEPGLIILLMSF